MLGFFCAAAGATVSASSTSKQMARVIFLQTLMAFLL
jgi:hypothetical protein